MPSQTSLTKSEQIWQHILKEETRAKAVTEFSLPFQAKTIHHYWNTVCEHEWKFASDPLESARKFIEARGAECNVSLLDVPAVPGTKVIAFQVDDIMGAWARNTQELAMDSTCQSSLYLAMFTF